MSGMHSRRNDQLSVEALEKEIRVGLLTALSTLSDLNLNISLYLLHHTKDDSPDPLHGNDLDAAYIMYEEKANDSRRLWMKVRAVSERRVSAAEAASSSLSRSRLDLGTSLPLLEYLSALGEDQPGGNQRNDQDAPVDLDPASVGQDLPCSPTPVVDPHPPKPKHKVRSCLL
jgi:hypothetical protein